MEFFAFSLICFVIAIISVDVLGPDNKIEEAAIEVIEEIEGIEFTKPMDLHPNKKDNG